MRIVQRVCCLLNSSLFQDHKLKHMAEMQQSVVGDSDARQQIANQVLQWEENLERLHCEQFRLRCYMASLQSGELPNPKVCSSISLVSHGMCDRIHSAPETFDLVRESDGHTVFIKDEAGLNIIAPTDELYTPAKLSKCI